MIRLVLGFSPYALKADTATGLHPLDLDLHGPKFTLILILRHLASFYLWNGKKRNIFGKS